MKHLKNINESDSSYYCDVKVEVNYYHSDYNGKEINEITADPIRIHYEINIESRYWGIKDISLFGIRGPEEIKLKISYYEDKEEDTEEEKVLKRILNPDKDEDDIFPDIDEIDDPLEDEIKIKINWENIKTEILTGKGVLTVDTIEIDLENDPEGGLIAAPRGELRKSGKLIVKNVTANIHSI